MTTEAETGRVATSHGMLTVTGSWKRQERFSGACRGPVGLVSAGCWTATSTLGLVAVCGRRDRTPIWALPRPQRISSRTQNEAGKEGSGPACACAKLKAPGRTT